ncbi:MAG: hypothetical protein QW835_03745 [Candidatus Hadarchaeum sp.]
MTELVSIKDMPVKLKIRLLRELGFDSDGKFVTKEGKKVLDKYTGEPIKISNMFIFPGSAIVLDNNPLSISSFLEEFGEVV